MTAHQLDESQRTQKSSKSGFHKVYFDDCDRRLLVIFTAIKMGSLLVDRPLAEDASRKFCPFKIRIVALCLCPVSVEPCDRGIRQRRYRVLRKNRRAATYATAGHRSLAKFLTSKRPANPNQTKYLGSS
jgi:hypothetical protein